MTAKTTKPITCPCGQIHEIKRSTPLPEGSLKVKIIGRWKRTKVHLVATNSGGPFAATFWSSACAQNGRPIYGGDLPKIYDLIKEVHYCKTCGILIFRLTSIAPLKHQSPYRPQQCATAR